MGLGQSTNKSNQKLYEEINKLNNLTTNELFYKRTGFFIEFYYGGCQGLCGKITAILFKILPDKSLYSGSNLNKQVGEKIRFKIISLSISKFYKFLNIFLDCLPIFSNNKFKLNLTDTPQLDEISQCPICLENPPNMLIDCNHLFCTKCIKSWIFNKHKNCPLCRKELIDISEIDKDKFSDKEYVIINKSDIHDPESYDEMDNNFVSALYEIL